VSSAGHGIRNNCAGEDHQQFTGLDKLGSCKTVASRQRRENGSSRISIVRSCYQATTSEDKEDFMCAAVQ
jgi:hypothetical protein